MDAFERYRAQIEAAKQERPLRDIAFACLREQILSGRYPHGHHLTEVQAASELGVSRTPVREAFRKLEREGLLVYESNRGVRITHMDDGVMLEIYGIMVALEGMAARLAADNATAQERAELTRRCAELEAALLTGDHVSAATLHRAFNNLLFAAGRNRRLSDLLQVQQDYIDRILSYSWARGTAEVIAEHRAILAAIMQGDGDAAERVTRQHVERARRAYLERSDTGADL